MANVELRNIEKHYGKTPVLRNINLRVKDGEFVVLVGPSGCGKSTTLRIIAGLEQASSGDVAIDEQVVNNMEPKDRNIAMVFQNYAIYPHLSVRKNIGFGLRTSKLSKAQKQQRIEDIAVLLSMHELLERKPSELSGGQRQRVAIGRAMVRDPAVFLFDEPLSNLDAQLRAQMRLEIKKLHQRVNNTIIFVTHDQIEAMTMADRIVIMNKGEIQQIGTPQAVYHKPANHFVAQFIGAPAMNTISGIWRNNAVLINEQLSVEANPRNIAQDTPVIVGIRPSDLHISAQQGFITGTVTVLEPLGSETLVHVDVLGIELIASASGRTPPALGENVSLYMEASNVHVFCEATGVSLT